MPTGDYLDLGCANRLLLNRWCGGRAHGDTRSRRMVWISFRNWSSWRCSASRIGGSSSAESLVRPPCVRCRAGPEAIAAGPYAEADCSKGGVTRLLTPGGDGMLSVIAENRPNERLSIKHVGTVNKGVDDTESDEVMTWASAYENYTLKEINRGTELTVDMNVRPEHEEIFLGRMGQGDGGD